MTVQRIAELIVRGGWPLNLRMQSADAGAANRDYLRTIAEVDLPRISGPRRDAARITRFIQALARNTAMEHVVTRLAAEAGGEDISLSRPSAHEYQDALIRLMILEVQPAWSTHLRSRARLRDRPRTHLVDPSLAAAALDATPTKLLRDLNILGLLFEAIGRRWSTDVPGRARGGLRPPAGQPLTRARRRPARSGPRRGPSPGTSRRRPAGGPAGCPVARPSW